MEEKILKIRKLNFFERFQKRIVLNKMKKQDVINSWADIKNQRIKYDGEIIDLVWKKVLDEKKYEILKEFPIGIQAEKGISEVDVIPVLDKEAQKIIVKKDVSQINYCTEEVREELVLENPKGYLRAIPNDERILIVARHQDVFNSLDEGFQKETINETPELILFCSDKVKETVLCQNNILSKQWLTIFRNDKNINLEKIFEYCEKYEKSTKNEEFIEIVSTYLKNRFKDISEIENLNEDRQKIFTLDFMGSNMEKISSEKQGLLFDFINEKVCEISHSLEYNGYNGYGFKPNNINFGTFDSEVIKKKFQEKYGKEKFSEYSDFLDEVCEGEYENINERFFRLCFNEESMISKVPPEKIIDYLKSYDEYKKYQKGVRKKIEGKAPLSEKIQKEKLDEKFKSIIHDAYDEPYESKAVEILEKRPGLDLFNIDNTEVFGDILHSYGEEIVHDLLSYEIERSDKLIKLSKNNVDMQAFRLYYNRMTNLFGRNAVTLQMCIDGYDEYKDILKTSYIGASEERLKKIDEVCSWPKNICGIKNVFQLDQFEERLEAIVKSEQQLNLESVRNGRDNYENKIYDYSNLPEDMELSKEEKMIHEIVSLYGNEIGKYGDKIGGLINERVLQEASARGVKLSSIFLNYYRIKERIKENQLEKLDDNMLSLEEIRKAAKERRDNVKVIGIDGIEFIDLGSMIGMYASHDPSMNNSNMSIEGDENTLGKANPKLYTEYEGVNGKSTISATLVKGFEEGYRTNKVTYIYWNFRNKEVMNLNRGDGRVSHGAKRLISKGNVTHSIKDAIKSKENLKEIAFYRRRRDNRLNSIERYKYGGKVMPDAISGDPFDQTLCSDLIEMAESGFGESIPIIVPRGSLQNKENIENLKKIVQQVREKQRIQNEKNKEDKENEDIER